MFPLVSCLMPTCAGRRRFIPDAVANFLAQDYPNKELIVLGDDDETIADLLPADSRIRYYQEPKKNHGEKMNRCAELSNGELLAVWDDDDFYVAGRLSRIVISFENHDIKVVGSSTLYYQDSSQGWQYTSPKDVNWLASISFRRETWHKYPFEPLQSGADWTFQQKVRQENPAAVLDLADPILVVAQIHSENACKKNTKSSDYVPGSVGDNREFTRQ